MWHNSMYGFNVTDKTFSYDNRPQVPLYNMNFDQWWMVSFPCLRLLPCGHGCLTLPFSTVTRITLPTPETSLSSRRAARSTPRFPATRVLRAGTHRLRGMFIFVVNVGYAGSYVFLRTAATLDLVVTSPALARSPLPSTLLASTTSRAARSPSHTSQTSMPSSLMTSPSSPSTTPASGTLTRSSRFPSCPLVPRKDATALGSGSIRYAHTSTVQTCQADIPATRLTADPSKVCLVYTITVHIY